MPPLDTALRARNERRRGQAAFKQITGASDIGLVHHQLHSKEQAGREGANDKAEPTEN